MNATPAVELRGVERSFEEGGVRRQVLAGANLTVAVGRAVALLGRSGSGKSTLLHLVGGLDRPDAGAVLLEGVRVDRLSERDRTLLRRRRIGFVFQSFDLLPTLTVLENLLLPLELERRARPADRERARGLLAEVGLLERADTFPDRLSGGEQQRVALARALVHEPAVILADEPTGNLDVKNSGLVFDLLARLAKENGQAVVLVTHNPDIANRCDEIKPMRDGEFVRA